MADKQLGIVVTGDIDDISSKLDTLASQIESLESKAIELTIEANTAGLSEVSSASETASAELESVSNSAEDVSGNIGSIDSTTLNEASSHANSLGGNIKNTSNNAKEMGQEVNNASQNAADGLQALAGAAAAIGSYLVLDNLLGAAGGYEDSWSRMTVALGGTVDTIGMIKDDWASAISDMSSTTGRGAGTIREFITQMSLAGVESKDVIQSSFEGIAGAAYVTGNDINTMTYALQRATRTGLLNQRTLTSLGLSTNDIMKATGKSIEQVSDEFEKMTPTARAAFLGMIYNAKFGTDANEAFKLSWEGVSEALGRAKGYLSIVFGQLILPIAIPATKALTGFLKDLSNNIASLDPISKGLLGGLVLLLGTFVALGGIIASGLAVWNALKISQGLVTIATWLNTDATITNTAIKEQSALANLKLIASEIRARAASIASTIAEGARGAAATASAAAQWILNTSIVSGAIATGRDVIAKVAHAAASVAQAVATGLATAAQWLLNAAMAANPIGLVVIAIAALVAGLYLLYQNNEQVRNSINGLWEQLQGLGAYIQSGFGMALDAMIRPFREIVNQIKNAGTGLYNAGRDWIKNLDKGIKDSMPELVSTIQYISDYFPRSPAKIGPLSDLSSDSMRIYGSSLISGFIQGIKLMSDFTPFLQPLRVLVLEYDNIVGYGTEDVKTMIKGVGDVANDVGNKAAEVIQESFTRQTEAARQFAEAAKAAYDEAASHASNAFSGMQSMLGAMGISLPKITYSPYELLQQRREAINSLQSQLLKLRKNYEAGNISSWEYSSTRRQLEEQIKQLNSHETLAAIMKSGQSVGQTWGAGVATGIQSSQQNINNAIANASRGLIAYSPPKEGPLSKVDEYGMSIGQTFTEYLSKGLGTAGNLFDFNTLPTPSASMVSSPSSGGGYNFYFGDVHVPEGSDPVEVGRGLAKGAHESFSERISDQAARRGTVIPNILR